MKMFTGRSSIFLLLFFTLGLVQHCCSDISLKIFVYGTLQKTITTIPYKQNMSVWDAMVLAQYTTPNIKFTYALTPSSRYFTGIDGLKENTTTNYYWFFYVDGIYNRVDADDAFLKDGQEIEWDYHLNDSYVNFVVQYHVKPPLYIFNVTYSTNLNVFDAMVRAQLKFTYNGTCAFCYITSIDDVFEDPAQSLYWLLYVNGIYNRYAVGVAPLFSQDSVRWVYTRISP